MTEERDLSRPPRLAAGLPVTGAWQEGDPPGDRHFFTLPGDRPFVLEDGSALDSVTLAYETWGTLDGDASNAILVCHALTGDAHAYDAHQSRRGWWQGVIGPGEAIDTERYFVVCANVLGGCQGTTGPASPNPATGRRWAAAFPPITIRDMVRTQAHLADHLGVKQWLCVVGGSMGGMQALEWGAMYPARVRSIAPLAVGCSASPWQIGWSAVGRTAIALDPRWRGGEYYDAPAGEGPHEGLALARAVAQITYRSDELFAERFGRSLVRPNEQFGLWDRYSVEGYLDYHGEKLVRRFDANSYLVLNKAMDTHDLGRGRGGLQRAVARISAPVLTLSISSDTLYPPRQQTELRDLVVAADGDCRYVVVESPHGHDGFLVETAPVSAALAELLEDVEKAGPLSAAG